MIMYGQVETLNQVINAWFSITFAEWCWVFMDGFWCTLHPAQYLIPIEPILTNLCAQPSKPNTPTLT